MGVSPKMPVEVSPFSELDVVRLRAVVSTDEGIIPSGAVGTIVYLHSGSDAYEVEFADPFPAVVTLREGDLARAA